MCKNRKLLLIQPHSDDLLFSCSHLLFSEEYEKEILTIENNPKRIAEDKRLYGFLGIPFHHLEVDFDDQSYYGYHKKYKEVNVSGMEEYLTEYFGKEKLEEIRTAFKEFINKRSNEDFIIVAPWGIGHPFHLFVRCMIERFCRSSREIWFYREFPHSYKKRSQAQVKNQSEDYDLISSVSVEEFDDVKWGLAKKFYKTQSSLLWFEQGYIKKKLNEEIYTDSLPF